MIHVVTLVLQGTRLSLLFLYFTNLSIREPELLTEFDVDYVWLSLQVMLVIKFSILTCLCAPISIFSLT